MVTSVTPAGRRSGAQTSSAGRIWRTSAVLCFVALPAISVLGWVALHRVPGLAPRIADTLRSIVGVDAVTWLEDELYAVEDRFNRVRHWGKTPRARWEVPAPEAPKAASAPQATELASAEFPALDRPA